MEQQTDRRGLGEWECMECGHIEEGLRTGQPKTCQECGAPVQALEFFPYEDDWDDETSGNPDGEDDTR